jgi:alginate O-acetyltransferase complex protein AlgI
MLFNSVTFLYFFSIVYFLYLLLFRHKGLQNLLLLVSSYIFYGYWDWRFLFLISISTVIDFFVGLGIGRTPTYTKSGSIRRKLLLSLSVIANLSILGFFKYFNFFIEGLLEFLELFGLAPSPYTLSIILPVGISFYTFQTMSYTIDVYRKRLEPAPNFLDFAVFVSFFPQLVAGPIERAVNLLPQIQRSRHITSEQVYAGLYLVLWGYFKKMVIADNIGRIADQVFNNYASYQGIDILLGVLAFSIQIYGDFSGYTDIARGIARLLGFELMINFRLPYFASNPADFWRRWHISLSSWLRDYLYIPLGGNRKGEMTTYRNLFLTMLLGGLWHGAAWNFVIWGAYHGLILILHRLLKKKTSHWPIPGGFLGKAVGGANIVMMFGFTLFGWLIFRSSSMEQIGYFLGNLSLSPTALSAGFLTEIAFFGLPLLLVQLFQHYRTDLLVMTKVPPFPRISFYAILLFWILIFGVRESTEFIYFQF